MSEIEIASSSSTSVLDSNYRTNNDDDDIIMEELPESNSPILEEPESSNVHEESKVEIPKDSVVVEEKILDLNSGQDPKPDSLEKQIDDQVDLNSGKDSMPDSLENQIDDQVDLNSDKDSKPDSLEKQNGSQVDSICKNDASIAAAIAAADEAEGSHSKRRSTNQRSCKKKGILGVPQGSKMLFMFNSKELWPDDNEDGELDSDEDYQPVASSSSGVGSKKPPKRRRSIVINGIQEDSGTEDFEIDEDEDFEEDDDDVDSSFSTSSSTSTPKKTKKLSKSKGKSSSPKKKKTPSNTAKKKKTAKKATPTKSSAKKPKAGATTKQKKSGQTKAPAAAAAAKKPTKKKKRKSYEETYVKPRNYRPSSAGAGSPSGNGSKSASTKISSTGAAAAATTTTASGGHHSKLQNGTTGFFDFNLLLKQLKYSFAQILPQDILIKIFQLVLELEQKRTQTLLKLSQVCDDWRRIIISTPILWQRLDLAGFQDETFPLSTFQLLNDDYQLFSSVRELDLARWNGPNAEKILEIVASSSNFDLELLNVKNCRNISSNFLQTVISNCRKLRSLDISAITSTSHQNCQNPFTAPIFRPLLENCGPNLQSLFMSENMMPSFPTCISIIMEFCSNLEVIDVSNVASLGARLTSIPIEKMQLSCPKLRILRAANVNFATSPSTVTPGFPHLEQLSIPFHENFMVPISILSGHSDAIIEQLTKASENLTLLDVRGARYITPRGLVKIPTWSLKHLSMSNCPKLEHDTLEMVFTKWNKSLVDVDLSWNKSESCVNACIATLCELDDEIGESPLKAIQLRGSALSYDSLKLLLKKCPKLSSIDLQSCRGLPRGIKRSYADDEFVQLRRDILDGKYE